MQVSNKSAVVYVPADMGYGGKGSGDVRSIVYSKK